MYGVPNSEMVFIWHQPPPHPHPPRSSRLEEHSTRSPLPLSLSVCYASTTSAPAFRRLAPLCSSVIHGRDSLPVLLAWALAHCLCHVHLPPAFPPYSLSLLRVYDLRSGLSPVGSALLFPRGVIHDFDVDGNAVAASALRSQLVRGLGLGLG
jgi:hypothetical protein